MSTAQLKRARCPRDWASHSLRTFPKLVTSTDTLCAAEMREVSRAA